MEVVVTHKEEEDDVLHWPRVFKGLVFFLFALIARPKILFFCFLVLVIDLGFLLVFILVSVCEALEENLRRDYHRAQPSCRELEISSWGNYFSGFLFYLIYAQVLSTVKLVGFVSLYLV